MGYRERWQGQARVVENYIEKEELAYMKGCDRFLYKALRVENANTKYDIRLEDC